MLRQYYISFSVDVDIRNIEIVDRKVKRIVHEIGAEFDGTGYGFGGREYFFIGTIPQARKVLYKLDESDVEVTRRDGPVRNKEIEDLFHFRKL